MPLQNSKIKTQRSKTRSKIKNFLVLLIVLVFAFYPIVNVRADELDEINRQIADLSKALEMSKSAAAGVQKSLKPIEDQINSIQKRIDNLAASIKSEENKIAKLEASITKRELELNDKYVVLASHIRKFYIRKSFDSPMLIFLSSNSASDLTREFGYRMAEQREDKKVIVLVAGAINELEADKKTAKETRERLTVESKGLESAQANLDKQAAPLRKVIKEAETYQSDVSGKIAALSARQQALLAEKLGNFTTSVGEVPLSDDPASQPTFNPGFSPAYAAFSFGAPHRVGMSQYGAYGRSKAGQSAEEILKAYYSGVEIKKDYPVPGTINVQGYGNIAFEDNYLKGIGEMPSSWGDQGGMEALKAQAIAARTYALAVTNNGAGSICATEACQVYIGHNKGGKWEEAVNATRGWVIVSGGQPIKAWYASTAGGFTRSSKDVFGGATSYAVGIKDTAGSWPDDAYEGAKYGRSPWFYKGWYKGRSGGATRSHPWLTSDEFSDILNCILLYNRDNGTISHLSQTDKSNSDTWSRDKVKEELRNRGVTPISSVSGVGQPVYSNAGYTQNISFNTDTGSVAFDGSVFKTIFNLRAPGEIHLQSSLFNVEKK